MFVSQLSKCSPNLRYQMRRCPHDSCINAKCRQNDTEHLKKNSKNSQSPKKSETRETTYQADNDRSDQKPVIGLLPSWVFFPHKVSMPNDSKKA